MKLNLDFLEIHKNVRFVPLIDTNWLIFKKNEKQKHKNTRLRIQRL